MRAAAAAVALFSTSLAATTSGLVASAPRASAVTCTISWANAAGGDWSTPANWSPVGLPGPADTACITLGGTYTVTLGTVGGAGLVSLGGASGFQHLTITSAPGSNAGVPAVVVNPRGALHLHSLTALQSVDITNMVFDEGGTVEVAAASGGTVTIGNLQIDAGTLVSAVDPASLLTAGELTTQPGTTITVGGLLQVADTATLSGGTIDASIGVLEIDSTLLLDAPTITGVLHSFAGTVTLGTTPVDVDVRPSLTAAGKVVLAGDVPAGATIRFIGGCARSAQPLEVDANNSFTNAGTIVFTDDGCGAGSKLVTKATKTFTNTGTLAFTPGGPRTLAGTTVSTGTFALGTAVVTVASGRLTFGAGSSFTVNADPLAPGQLQNLSTLSVVLGGQLAPTNVTSMTTGSSKIVITGKFSGTFGSYSGLLISTTPTGGTYARPSYSGTTGVKLSRTTAKVVLVPTTAPHGTDVGVTVSNMISNESVTLVFKDAGGHTTSFGPFPAVGGKVITTVTIPATATLGAGRITAFGSLSPATPKATITVS